MTYYNYSLNTLYTKKGFVKPKDLAQQTALFHYTYCLIKFNKDSYLIINLQE